MKSKVVYTKSALKDLKKLSKGVARQILEKVSFFLAQKDPLVFAKKLKDPLFGTYRFRVGDYRVIFDVDLNGNLQILLILKVKHRKDVYRGV